MGSRMAANLLQRGFKLAVWNREADALRPLVDAGATPAPSPEALAAQSDVVFSILWDDEVSREIVLGRMIPAARAGTTFIEMSTISGAMQRRLGEAANERGCSFLAAPVTGSKEAAANGELTALVAGPAAVLAAQRDVLSAVAAQVVHVGDYGTSAALKLGNNMLIGVLLGGLGESLRVTDAAGIDRRLALDTFIGTVARVAAMKRAAILERDWTPHFTVSALEKDLRAAADAALEADAVLPLLAATSELYKRLIDDGKGHRDFSIVADGTVPSEERATI